MRRFREVPDRYDPAAVEARIFDYWDEVNAYEQTKDHRADGETFFFVDGPPYTSGAAHLGTTWNKTLKDAIIRYLRMQGYDVTDRPGYDMHGLPIETKVEERLGFDSKKDIEELGEEAFIEECKAFAESQLEGLQSDFQSFGVWMDWDDPYKTIDPTYMEAAWWAFSHVDERGLVERGKRSISQCPRCETAIANNEVEYHQVEDPSIYVQFPLADREGSLVIWTTTPWTIPANTFVAVDPELSYQAVRADRDGEKEVLWIAEACVEDVLREGRYSDYEVLETISGEEMVGWAYEHPLSKEIPDHPEGEATMTVQAADYVEADRTGLVHSAPGHGEVDFERGQELGMPVFCPVGPDGIFTDAAGKYAGTFVRDANDEIIEDLEAGGNLLASGTTTHSYGQCWRCDTDIIQIVTDQWFITVTDIKDELLENIEASEWYPEWARDNRFRDFVESAPDWNVSRQRYWGIPVPIWTPEGASPEAEAEDMIVIGTREALAERVDQDIDPETVDLHKPTVDDLTITEDGKTYTRVPDVFDVWLDSSVATWGTLDYPEEDEAFDNLWPADLIVEAHDQTRGWFWSQLGMGTAALGASPYESVLMHGHALDSDGRKMSKSLGNVVEPSEAIDRHGADAMRMFLLSVTPQGDDMRFSWEEMATMKRDLNIAWNVFRFPLPYMRLDAFDPEAASLETAELETIDAWVLARLTSTVETATESWETFRPDRALEAILEFIVEDLSRYYIQVTRERMWEESASASKQAAYTTLYTVLEDVVALLAPYAPFITEEMYQTLTGDTGYESVHMLDWPEPRSDFADPQLEREITWLRRIEEAGATARQRAGRKRRWPIRRLVVDLPEAGEPIRPVGTDSDVDTSNEPIADHEAIATAVETHAELLGERLNADSIEVIEPGEEWGELSYSAKADMSELGPAFGSDAQAVMEALNNASVEEPTVEAFESVVAEALGTSVTLDSTMLTVVAEPPADIEGVPFDIEGIPHGVVFVDATLTESIERIGYAREVIRRVQELRKDLELDVDAAIRLDLTVEDDRVARLLEEEAAFIDEEVRAAERGSIEDGERIKETVEGVTFEIAIAPLPEATV